MSCALTSWVLPKQAHSARNEVEKTLASSFTGMPELWHSGGEQKAPLQPSCAQDCLQGAQLAVWHTAVHMAHSCLQDAQLPAGCPSVHMAQCGTQLCLGHSCPWCSALQGTVISRCTAMSEHTAVCGVHSWLRIHSCLQEQLSAAVEFQ